MQDIATSVSPKQFITTGTGGAIGANVKLGDVVIAGTVRFDCQTQFAKQPWAKASYATAPLPAGALAALTPALTSANAARIPGARSAPQFFSGDAGTVVTTDFFAFDASSDFYSIRNASDPQIPNPNHNIRQAGEEAAKIYSQYGGFTTAAGECGLHQKPAHESRHDVE